MPGNFKVTVAKDAGFCFGVRDAIEKAKAAVTKYGKVYMLGNIVHNERVVSDLEKRDIRVVKSLQEATDAPVLFRAHGTIPDLWEKAQEQGVEIIDATCPLVYEIHHEIKKLHEEDRRIFIIGDHGHDEVVAIQAQVPDATVISTPAEARTIGRVKKAGIVSQSTQMIENVQEIINILMMQVFDLKFVNTICFPTRRNQDQIKELAAVNDVMIVVGSYTSANTKRLVFVAKKLNPRTYQVENAEDVKIEWFAGATKVGVSAGASSPDDLIQEVVERIKSF